MSEQATPIVAGRTGLSVGVQCPVCREWRDEAHVPEEVTCLGCVPLDQQKRAAGDPMLPGFGEADAGRARRDGEGEGAG